MGFIDKAASFVGDGLGSIVDSIGDAIMTALNNFVGMLLYYLTAAVMWLVSILQQLFDVFVGTTKVQYNDEYSYLLDVFFQNKSVSNVYWAMALLGIVFAFVFTMIAVIRKIFDINDKQQKSMGAILGGLFKSVFVMLVLTVALSAILTLTNLAINRISYIFDNADSLSEPSSITFTDEEFATMARIYKTIGNYSLNPSYSSRYNLNSCFNDIRSDLRYLEQLKVFNMVYHTEKDGVEIKTWQSELQKLSYAADTSKDLKLDVYYEETSNALLSIMETLKTNANFYPLEYYQSGVTTINTVGLDRILFLSGTVSAARNSQYNKNPYLTDGLRGAFFVGEKSIYSFSEVKSAFEIGVTGINYIFILVLAYFTIRNLLRCIFSCVMRLFTMVALYIVGPLTAATMPIDDGEKFRQWTTAMVVQGLGVLGAIIPMRLVILFAPIILDSNLVLFESVTLNFIAKVIMIVGGMEAMEGFGDIVTGILVNNAGYQALRTGDQSKGIADRTFGGMKTAARGAGRVGLGAAKVASDITGLTAVGRGVAAAGGVIAGGAKSAYNAITDHGGLLAAGGAVAAGGLAAGGLAVAGIGAGAYYGGKGIGKGISAVRNYFSDKKLESLGVSGSQNLETLSSTPSGAAAQAPQAGAGQKMGDAQSVNNAVQNMSNSVQNAGGQAPQSLNHMSQSAGAKSADAAGGKAQQEKLEKLFGAGYTQKASAAKASAASKMASAETNPVNLSQPSAGSAAAQPNPANLSQPSAADAATHQNAGQAAQSHPVNPAQHSAGTASAQHTVQSAQNAQSAPENLSQMHQGGSSASASSAQPGPANLSQPSASASAAGSSAAAQSKGSKASFEENYNHVFGTKPPKKSPPPPPENLSGKK